MFTLTAIAGLMGATMRIPASFFIRLSGGRNTIFLTTALLIIPAVVPASRCRTRMAAVGVSA
jgi:NNP family nitrate/nitrite transporter-like MFS transporter